MTKIGSRAPGSATHSRMGIAAQCAKPFACGPRGWGCGRRSPRRHQGPGMGISSSKGGSNDGLPDGSRVEHSSPDRAREGQGPAPCSRGSSRTRVSSPASSCGPWPLASSYLSRPRLRAVRAAYPVLHSESRSNLTYSYRQPSRRGIRTLTIRLDGLKRMNLQACPPIPPLYPRSFWSCAVPTASLTDPAISRAYILPGAHDRRPGNATLAQEPDPARATALPKPLAVGRWHATNGTHARDAATAHAPAVAR